MPDTPTIQINNPQGNSNDHDLLISIVVKLDRAIADIKELKDDTTDRVTDLEQEKVGKDEFDIYKAQCEKDSTEFKKNLQDTLDDHEGRIRYNTKWIQYGLGACIVLNFLLVVYQIYKSAQP